jgi:hypothetical protein
MALIAALDQFLGSKRRRELVGLLDGAELKWSSSAALGHTGVGNTLQLPATSDVNRRVRRALRQLFVPAVREAVRNLSENHTTNGLDGFAFPVRMMGDHDCPPRQLPHRDRQGDSYPEYVGIYYAVVEGVAGGALVGYSDDGETAEFSLAPEQDRLVIIRGDQLHEVEPLTAGIRTCVVCNLFAEVPSALRSSVDFKTGSVSGS